MKKAGYIILLVVLLVVAIFYMFKLDTCSNNFKKLTSIYARNADEIKILNEHVNELKNRENECKIKLLKKMDKKISEDIHESFDAEASCGSACSGVVNDIHNPYTKIKISDQMDKDGVCNNPIPPKDLPSKCVRMPQPSSKKPSSNTPSSPSPSPVSSEAPQPSPTPQPSPVPPPVPPPAPRRVRCAPCPPCPKHQPCHPCPIPKRKTCAPCPEAPVCAECPEKVCPKKTCPCCPKVLCPPCPKLSRVIFNKPLMRDQGMCLSKLPEHAKCMNKGDIVTQECQRKIISGETLTEQDLSTLKKYGDSSHYSISPLNYQELRKPIVMGECGNNYYNQQYCNTEEHTAPSSISNNTVPSSISNNIVNNETPLPPVSDETLGTRCYHRVGDQMKPGPSCVMGDINCFNSPDTAPVCGENTGKNANCWKLNNNQCQLHFGSSPNNKDCFQNKKKCEEQNGIGIWEGNTCHHNLLGDIIDSTCKNLTKDQCQNAWSCSWKRKSFT